MSVKEIKLEIDNGVCITQLFLESDSEQRIVHVTLKDLDRDYKEVSATGVILDAKELEELKIAIENAIDHQKRYENS